MSTKPETVLSRYRTAGGATVEVVATRFATRFDYRGAPYAAAEPYEVDGFQWRCLGCCAYGREGDIYYDPGYREESEARENANAHAKQCQAMSA